jgi:protein TonB
MSTLTLPQGPSLRLNWPRVGALSGTLSLHLLAISLLLIPATAMQLIKPPPADVIVAHWVEPKPPLAEEPVLPKPPPLVRHEVRRQPTPVPEHTPVASPPADSNMPSQPADPGPPAKDEIPAAAADTAPTALAYYTRTRVAYPREAIALRQQGTVILRVLVGTDGIPQAVEIETSSGSRSLDNAARDAVKRWTFQAGTRNGMRTALWARVPVRFDLLNLQ